MQDEQMTKTKDVYLQKMYIFKLYKFVVEHILTRIKMCDLRLRQSGWVRWGSYPK
jgi:hypothetical protein